MVDLTPEERRVYTAALMGGVRLEKRASGFYLAGTEITDTIVQLRRDGHLTYARNRDGKCEFEARPEFSGLANAHLKALHRRGII